MVYLQKLLPETSEHGGSRAMVVAKVSAGDVRAQSVHGCRSPAAFQPVRISIREKRPEEWPPCFRFCCIYCNCTNFRTGTITLYSMFSSQAKARIRKPERLISSEQYPQNK